MKLHEHEKGMTFYIHEDFQKGFSYDISDRIKFLKSETTKSGHNKKAENELFRLMHYCGWKYHKTRFWRWEEKYHDIKNYIAELYMPMVEKCVDIFISKITYYHPNRDDLFSEAIDVLNIVLMKFNPWRENGMGNTMAFSTYLICSIKRRCYRSLKSIINNQNFIQNMPYTYKIEECISDKEFHPIDPNNITALRKILKNNMANLTQEEIDLIDKRYNMQGKEKMTFENIAHERGISFQAVHQQLQVAFDKLIYLCQKYENLLDSESGL